MTFRGQCSIIIKVSVSSRLVLKYRHLLGGIYMTSSKKTKIAVILYSLFVVYKLSFLVWGQTEDNLLWHSPISMIIYQFTKVPLKVLDIISIVWIALDIIFLFGCIFIFKTRHKIKFALAILPMLYIIDVLLLLININLFGFSSFTPMLAVISSVFLISASKNQDDDNKSVKSQAV